MRVVCVGSVFRVGVAVGTEQDMAELELARIREQRKVAEASATSVQSQLEELVDKRVKVETAAAKQVQTKFKARVAQVWPACISSCSAIVLCVLIVENVWPCCMHPFPTVEYADQGSGGRGRCRS